MFTSVGLVSAAAGIEMFLFHLDGDLNDSTGIWNYIHILRLSVKLKVFPSHIETAV